MSTIKTMDRYDVKKGWQISLSWSYGVDREHRTVTVVRDFNMKEQVARFKAQARDPNNCWDFDDWLVKMGFTETTAKSGFVLDPHKSEVLADDPVTRRN